MLAAYVDARLPRSQHVLSSLECVVSCASGQRLQSFKVCVLQARARFPLSCDRSWLSWHVVYSRVLLVFFLLLFFLLSVFMCVFVVLPANTEQ